MRVHFQYQLALAVAAVGHSLPHEISVTVGGVTGGSSTLAPMTSVLTIPCYKLLCYILQANSKLGLNFCTSDYDFEKK